MKSQLGVLGEFFHQPLVDLIGTGELSLPSTFITSSSHFSHPFNNNPLQPPRHHHHPHLLDLEDDDDDAATIKSYFNASRIMYVHRFEFSQDTKPISFDATFEPLFEKM